MSKDLRSLQQQFQAFLLGESTLEPSLLSTDADQRNTRLGIYHYAYRARLVDDLVDNYPVLQVHLGETLFENVALDYIKAYPSSFRSIRWYGDQLPDFLLHHPIAQSYPYLTELAYFEWMQTLVFDAADACLVTIDAMLAIPPDEWAMMKFQLLPSVKRVNFHWNVVPIWQAITDEQPLPQPVESVEAVPWIIWRRDFLHYFQSLTSEEAFVMDAMLNDCNFGTICEGLCQFFSEETVGGYVASLLKKWIHSGLLKEVIVTQKE